MKPKIIVTGFEPFSVYPVNSSWQAAKVVENAEDNVFIKELKVDRVEAHHQLMALLQAQKTDILLLSGLADRRQIALETKACKPIELAFVDGSEVLYGQWPWKDASAALQSLNIPFGVSENAGKYVCESIYWSALNFRRTNGYPRFIAFLHVPVISGEWTADRIADAMKAFVNAGRAHFSANNFSDESSQYYFTS